MPDASVPPLHVSSTAATKTLFAISGDPRVRYHLAGDPAAPAPDVLVVPMARPELPFDRLVAQAPAQAWARVAAGRALLVFDGSTEGHPPDPHFSRRLHSFLDRHDLPRGQAALVTQDRSYREVYAAWCDSDLEGEPVHVLNYDYFIKHLARSHEADGPEVFEQRLAAFRARPARRARRFMSLNFTARPVKVYFLLKLIEMELWEQGFISFGGFAPEGSGKATMASVIAKRLRTSAALGPPTPGQMAAIETLAAKGAVYLSDLDAEPRKGGRRKPPVLDAYWPEFDQSWFTVITETEIEGPRRITEKPLKPLLGLHPTLVLGNPGSLALLRELGFRTFYGYFDEAYDEEPHPRRRFMRVFSELVRLCRLDEAELARLEAEWAETLTFNAHWGLTRLPAVYRDRIDPAFIDQVCALLGRPDRLAV